MQRHLLAVTCLGTVVVASVAWTQDPPLPIEAPNQELVNVLGHSFEEASRLGDDELRERLLKLVEEKAQLMDREALEEALSDAQDDIGELQAERKLNEVRRILSSIVQEHVGTDGAATAQHMLHAATEAQTGTHYAIVEPEGSSLVRTELSESELRRNLLQISEEKAQLMDRDALERELASVREDIVELQALHRLEEARRILSSIVEEQEETEGAGRAQRMLDADKPSSSSATNPYFPGNPI